MTANGTKAAATMNITLMRLLAVTKYNNNNTFIFIYIIAQFPFLAQSAAHKKTKYFTDKNKILNIKNST